MTKQEFLAHRNYFMLVHGVTMRAIGALSDGDLDFRPQPGMRSPRELVFHIYSQEKILAEAARQGQFTMEMAMGSNPEGPSSAATLAALASVSDLLAFADACHQTAEAAFNAMSEDEIARTVDSIMGPYPAWRYSSFAYDEHWHHRGQLYVYLRLLGKTPPDLYDYQ